MKSLKNSEWFLLGLGALTVLVLYEFLLPMIAGAVMALMFHPLHVKLIRWRRWPKTWAGVLVGILTLGLLLPLAGLLFSSGNELLGLIRTNYKAILSAPQTVVLWSQKLPLPPEILDQVTKLLDPLLRSLLTMLQQTLWATPKVLLATGVALATAYVGLAHKKMLKEVALKNRWFTAAQNQQIMTTLYEVTYSVIWASVATGLLQSLTMVLGLLVIGNPHWLVLGGLTFLFAFMPVIGTSPISWGLLLFYFKSANSGAMLTMAVVIALLLVIDNLLRPYLIGNRARIHPLLAFVSAIGGLTLFGFYGLFLGPVVVGTFLALHQELK